MVRRDACERCEGTGWYWIASGLAATVARSCDCVGPPRLLLWGSWSHPGDPMAAAGPGRFYVISARCSTGCHAMADIVEPDDVPAILPDAERNFRLAFQRAHPA